MFFAKKTQLPRAQRNNFKTSKRNASLLAESIRNKDSVEVKYNGSETFLGEVTVSKLVNGVNVISKSGSGVDTTFGVYVNAGRNKENSTNAGVTSLFPRLSLKSTANTSGIRVTRFIESITGDFNAKVGRETVEYHANFLKPNAYNIAIAMAEILRPRAAEWEVRDSIDEIKLENQTTKQLNERIVDAIYFQAYKGQGVGRLPSSNFSRINQHIIHKYVSDNFVGNAVTLVGVGINHDALLEAAGAFEYLPLGENQKVSSVYYGGDYLEEDPKLGFTSLTIAYPILDENTVGLRVLANILGSVSKSSSEIGSGASSRFSSVVSSSQNVNTLRSFVLDSSNSGGNYPFFAVSGTSNVESTAELQNTLFHELNRLDSFTESEVRKAANLAKLQFISDIESQSAMKDMLYYSNGRNPLTLLPLFDAVNVSSLKNVVSKTLSSKPTVVCLGNLNGFAH